MKLWVDVSGTTGTDVESKPVATTELPPPLGQKGGGEGESRSVQDENDF